MDLSNYETVKSRKKRFYKDNPDGRIIVDCLKYDDDHAVFKVSIFRHQEDQAHNLPWATGFAQEFQGKGSFANKNSWLENAEESAVGRALDNAGYSGNDKCSREEMIKATKEEL